MSSAYDLFPESMKSNLHMKNVELCFRCVRRHYFRREHTVFASRTWIHVYFNCRFRFCLFYVIILDSIQSIIIINNPILCNKNKQNICVGLNPKWFYGSQFPSCTRTAPAINVVCFVFLFCFFLVFVVCFWTWFQVSAAAFRQFDCIHLWN